MIFGKDEKDDFWDVEKLLPKKKTHLTSFSTKEKTVEFLVDGLSQKDSERTKLTERPTVSEENGTCVYEFSEGLLRRVTIKRFVDKYDFYGNFRKAALVYYDFKTPKCDFVPFYSYMPQYSQFNSQQKNFYFYFRDCVRRGKYIKTDYSYLYLYVYEILNLPDKISKEDGLDMLVSLWCAYRQDLPNIDANMSLWVQDYCLVYNLSCPMERIRSFVFDVIGSSEFKEFYLSDAANMGTDGVGAMLAYLSDYDWRSGKFAGGENKEFYTKHLLCAMGKLLNELWNGTDIIPREAETATVSRSAFRNSLCTHSVKCRLEIEYIPLSKEQELRNSITGAIRYTENKLRALIGVKSRLSIKDIPDNYKMIIDNYFEDLFKKAESERKKAEMPEYERLYDAENKGLSYEGADEIERVSWSTTVRLVEEIEEDISEFDEKNNNSSESTPLISSENISEAETYGLGKNEIEFIKAVKESDNTAIKNASDMSGLQPDALADKVNEAFFDGFGDVIIECINGQFEIIEDYLEDVKKWLMNLTK